LSCVGLPLVLKRFRTLSVVILLVVFFACFVGAMTSHRVAIANYAEVLSEEQRSDFAKGAYETGRIVQSFLLIILLEVLALSILALMPHSKGPLGSDAAEKDGSSQQ
jgi:heme A synthase